MPSTLEKLISLARRGREKNRNICPNGYVSLPVDRTRVHISPVPASNPKCAGDVANVNVYMTLEPVP
jgi:hypothetical protein